MNSRRLIAATELRTGHTIYRAWVNASDVRFGSSGHFRNAIAMSALPPKADILCGERNDTEHGFSHPISHRTPRYVVGYRGTRRFVIGEKCLNFRMKPNHTIQGGIACNGLGNRCYAQLSSGTAV